MRTGPAACALFGVVLLACGRTVLLALPDITSDAGTAADASATLTRGAPGPSATADAGDMPEDGSSVDVLGPSACHVDPSMAALSCTLGLPPNSSPCGKSEYVAGCTLPFMVPGPSGNGTVPDGCFDPAPYDNGVAHALCCRCLDGDAGVACVNTDLSNYDLSCTRDSDCRPIVSGALCAQQCPCPNAAINVRDWTRYLETIAPVPSPPGACYCPAAQKPVCNRGMCTLEY